MTVSLKHAFTSNVADSGDTTLVQPSNWNAEHTLTAAANTLLGAVTAGAVTEITCTAAGRTLIAGATAAAQATSLGLGTTDSPTFGSSITLNSSSTYLPQMILNNTAADSSGPYWFTKKLRGSSPANSGDSLGTFVFQSNGNDGLTYNSAFLTAISEGAGATWHAAGFGFNTINTSGVTARRMRIRASGCVAIGSDGAENFSLYVAKAITGGGSAYGTVVETSVQSDVTTLGVGFATALSTVASAFTIPTLQHYRAYQVTIGAGSTVSDQMGFFTSSTVIGATNNYAFYSSNLAGVTAGKTAYGFYSAINSATGGGTTYAFYSAGTAPNVFAGTVSIGTSVDATANLYLTKTLTGGINAFGIASNGQFQSDVTNLGVGVGSTVATAAASFTLTTIAAFRAAQATFGAGSTVTTQYGYFATSSLIGATNNYAFVASDTATVTAGKSAYGFYSSVNTASGGGTTYAFYAAGTATSVFSGAIGVGTTSLTGYTLRVTRNISGATTAYAARIESTIQSDVTGLGSSYSSVIGTAAAAFSTQITHYDAAQGSIGAGSTVTAQYGFLSRSSLIGATNNFAYAAFDTSAIATGNTAYGFYSAINIATGGGTAYAVYTVGTAPSVFSGNVGIGSTSLTNVIFRISKAITGSTTSYGVFTNSTVQSDVTASAVVYYSGPTTAAAAFTLGNLTHFYASAGTAGAGSTITNQYGFRGDASLIDATTNYSFYAANTAAVGSSKTSYGFYSNVAVASGGGTTWSFYSASTGWNYFSGPVITADVLWLNAPAPAAKTTTATLTAAEIKTGIISATGTSYTLTMPLATDIDSSFSGLPSNTNIGFDFSVVNAASGTVTIAVNTGITYVGSLSVFTQTSATFRLRRTAANTYIMYRLS